jgi:hypothetical protein
VEKLGDNSRVHVHSNVGQDGHCTWRSSPLEGTYGVQYGF